MPKRFTNHQYRRLYPKLVQRDGPACGRCGLTPKDPEARLTIDHINGNHRDNAFANLRILCRGCNTADMNERLRAPEPQVTREREKSMEDTKRGMMKGGPVAKTRTDQQPAVPYPRDRLDFSDEDLPMSIRISRQYQERADYYIRERLAVEPEPTYADFLYAGIKHVGCSESWVVSFIRRECSSAGTLELFRDARNIKRIRAKR